MKIRLVRALTAVRDTLSGRRRLASYADPEAHRRGAGNRDGGLARHYIPTPPPPGGGGWN